MHPVVRKLSNYASFSEEEESALALAFTRTFEIGAKQEVVWQDDQPENVLFLISGVAARHKSAANGRRQILALMVPGDACDMGVTLLERRDHGIATLNMPSTFARTSQESLRHLSDQYPKIRDALTWSTLMDESISREWIMNVGQRTADERTAHLFCEMHARLNAVGMTDGHNFHFPLTQSDLSATLGLSAVHVNRTLRTLRNKGLVALGDHRLTILDEPELKRLAQWDPTYLHLEARYSAKSAG